MLLKSFDRLRRSHLWRKLGLAQTRCVHCLTPFTVGDNPGQGGSFAPLCPDCAPLFAPFDGPRCRACALPLPMSGADEHTLLCGECLDNPPPWDGISAYGLYQGAMRDVVLRLKFSGEIPLANLLGACLNRLTAVLTPPDALTAVPQHPRRLHQRGFNQAHEIAAALHRLTGIPLRPELLRRTRPHILQTNLSGLERRRNARHFFQTTHQAEGLRLWLVDDVMTTGATLRAAAQTLRDGGARETRVLVVARTPQD
ncbi:MAG: ComF family protein [Desulfovibrio sp.]|jgi:ComF family protein|nr:ComF family protein [Desulfovibrio sp.]